MHLKYIFLIFLIVYPIHHTLFNEYNSCNWKKSVIVIILEWDRLMKIPWFDIRYYEMLSENFLIIISATVSVKVQVKVVQVQIHQTFFSHLIVWLQCVCLTSTKHTICYQEFFVDFAFWAFCDSTLMYASNFVWRPVNLQQKHLKILIRLFMMKL